MQPPNPKFNVGLIINPYAGIGGSLALKGSDGIDIREQALAAGAKKHAQDKTQLALAQLLELKDRLQLFTVAGEMGADLATKMHFDCQIVYAPQYTQTEADDTQQALAALLDKELDLLLFAGGDGTARDVLDTLQRAASTEVLPVLGIPAGCKIHSGVYAVTPAAAGRVAAMLVTGQITSVDMQEVRDIDEQASRNHRVSAKYYGELLVPRQLQYVQAVKSAGKESESLVLDDLASWLTEQMQDDPECLYIMGAGSTVAHIMQQANLENSLLGIDLVKNMQVVAKDVSEQQLLNCVSEQPCKLVITLIGSQGHVFGRGNQQLSPAVLKHIKRQNIWIVSTKSKLKALSGRPLIADTHDAELDASLSGLISVITGYNDRVLCPLVHFSAAARFAEKLSLEQIARISQAFFDDQVEHGSDDELFASSYLSGHFDLVLSRFAPDSPVALIELDTNVQQSLSAAFAAYELEVSEQPLVMSSWQALFALLQTY